MTAMRQVVVELRRFRSRRAIALTLLLAVAAVVLLAAATVWSTRSATEAEVAAAGAQLEVERADLREDLQRCLERDPGGSAADEGSAGADVSDAERCQELDPQLEWYLPRETLDLADEQRSAGLATALLLTGAAVVVGATFAGADWQARSLSTQLLFEPRRLRVWTAKAAAVVLGLTVVVLIVTVAFWSALIVVARSRGLAVAGDTLQAVSLYGARTVALSAAAGLGAFALTMALRSTMATLALLFAYVAAGEALLASLSLREAGRWSLANNVQAWLLDGVEVFDAGLCPPGAGTACDPTFVVSGVHGAAYLGILLAVAVVVSVLSFTRRDVP